MRNCSAIAFDRRGEGYSHACPSAIWWRMNVRPRLFLEKNMFVMLLILIRVCLG